MTEPDSTIETNNIALDAYLEGMIEGNEFAGDLDALVTLSQKLKRDTICVITIKYIDLEQISEDDE